MTYLMQPLALSKKSIGQLFNDNVQENTFPTCMNTLLIFLRYLFIV